jgi:hypothetical protein
MAGQMTKSTPPYGSEVDLSDFKFMPLEVQRLRDSRIASTVTGDEFMAAILLWCASWHQVPAGSLPDDDAELAKFAGFGRVVKEWRKVKSGALYGWVTCSDGRLYHPVVAEKVWESWFSKIEHAHSKECDRIRKENKKREKDNAQPLDFPAKPVFEPLVFPAESKSEQQPNPDRSTGIPAENALKGQGQGQGQGESSLGTAQLPPEPIPPESAPPDGVASPDEQPDLLTTESQDDEPDRRAAKTQDRGSKLPPDWQPDPKLVAFARDLNLDPAWELGKFLDHWTAKAGKDARKSDWGATFRNWCRTSAERKFGKGNGGSGQGSGRSGGGGLLAAGRAAASGQPPGGEW